ncbi:MAG: hypothetical protein K0Q71_347 [Thermomicrobiales bacterium]|jgi:hypothetical protein|nr:hypothetical protein [Thermomicrobiales bacterium]
MPVGTMVATIGRQDFQVPLSPLAGKTPWQAAEDFFIRVRSTLACMPTATVCTSQGTSRRLRTVNLS